MLMLLVTVWFFMEGYTFFLDKDEAKTQPEYAAHA